MIDKTDDDLAAVTVGIGDGAMRCTLPFTAARRVSQTDTGLAIGQIGDGSFIAIGQAPDIHQVTARTVALVERSADWLAVPGATFVSAVLAPRMNST